MTKLVRIDVSTRSSVIRTFTTTPDSVVPGEALLPPVGVADADAEADAEMDVAEADIEADAETDAADADADAADAAETVGTAVTAETP